MPQGVCTLGHVLAHSRKALPGGEEEPGGVVKFVALCRATHEHSLYACATYGT